MRTRDLADYDLFECESICGRIHDNDDSVRKPDNRLICVDCDKQELVMAEDTISRLPREKVVEILEGKLCIQCRDSESTGDLREALWDSFKAGDVDPGDLED